MTKDLVDNRKHLETLIIIRYKKHVKDVRFFNDKPVNY